MQKALQQMNGPLTPVLSDITGATGLTIIRAMVAGEREPVPLARFRDPRGVRSTEAMATALTGPYRPAHVFALPQAFAVYDTYTAPVRECDLESAQPFHAIRPVWPDALPPVNGADKRLSHGKHAPIDEARPRLYQLMGVDLVAISGLQASTVHTLRSEIGLDLRKWPHAKAFCAGLG